MYFGNFNYDYFNYAISHILAAFFLAYFVSILIGEKLTSHFRLTLLKTLTILAIATITSVIYFNSALKILGIDNSFYMTVHFYENASYCKAEKGNLCDLAIPKNSALAAVIYGPAIILSLVNTYVIYKIVSIFSPKRKKGSKYKAFEK